MQNGSRMSVLFDFGTSANCISKISYVKLMPRPQLSSTTTKIYPLCSNVLLPGSGEFKCSVEKGQKMAHSTFFVIKGDCFSVVNYKKSRVLDVLKIVMTVSSTPQCSTVADELVESHPELFQGIAKLKDF